MSETKDFQMDYNWEIGESLGPITFDMTPEDVEKLLGKPNEIREELEEETEYGVFKTIEWEYEALGITVAFEYVDDDYQWLTVFSDSLLLDGEEMFEFLKDDLLHKLEEVYNEFEIDFYFDTETNEENIEMCIFYDLGLTLWFEGTELVSACVSFSEDDNFEEEEEEGSIHLN